uniref:Uncharacterized protein n=1 Tax=Leersia perrieri TaxID=77586 RepID=A0A0D9XK03_9ORYZ
MQLFHLVAAWLFPCAVCATPTPAYDDKPETSSSSPLSPSSLTGDHRLDLAPPRAPEISHRSPRKSSRSPPPPVSPLGVATSSSPPRGCSASPPYSRSPEAAKDGALGSYIRRISKRLTTTRSGGGAAEDESSPPAVMEKSLFPLVGEGRRKDGGGSAIATEEEIRAFVIANNGSRAIALV